tara:strand:+ start:321 stop:923 length:603 start_codon:yes stop_codon:yes gene_type:complete
MKVTIPESIKDIKLSQFQKLVSLPDTITDAKLSIEKIKIFVGLTDEQIKSISQTDKESLVKSIDEALNKPREFEPRFKMGGVEFGFHPNLNDMSTAEHGDLMEYNSEPEELHRLMAILFRPITGKDLLGNYTIAKYNGTSEYCEAMKNTPLNIVNGALVFFLSLSKELRICFLKSSKAQELAKGQQQQIFGLSGVGMQAT